ncbi:tRNA (adenosine(37)-N6)-threonylcarbamoyltransferase complex dimerization subunit type 1 TsaB [Bryocella elongata]|nr:tRNA (adenosine(37)-N6)-threonylcarbamoyltransferase complex dimerization subunit type 1 TsaB [Bryocella elongata]
MKTATEPLRMLAIDTCGEGAGVALSVDAVVTGVRELPSRTASAEIIATIRELLANEGLTVSELDGIGVVAGPGSFTGVRTGLAVAKGICEALQLPLATVSRLEVLAHAASLDRGIAVLGAGRRDLYVLRLAEGGASEEMSTVEALVDELKGEVRVIVAEAAVMELLATLRPVLHPLSVADAVPLLNAALRVGSTDLGSADANYVRRESELYAKQGSGPACVRP